MGYSIHPCVWVQHQKQPYTHNPVLLSHMPLVPFFLSKRSGPYSSLNMPKTECTDCLHKSVQSLLPGPVFLLGLVVLPLCRVGNCWWSPDSLSLCKILIKVCKNTHKEHCLNCFQIAIQSLWVLSFNNSLSVHGFGKGQLNKWLYHYTAKDYTCMCRCVHTCSFRLRPSLERCIRSWGHWQAKTGWPAGMGRDCSLFVIYAF